MIVHKEHISILSKENRQSFRYTSRITNSNPAGQPGEARAQN